MTPVAPSDVEVITIGSATCTWTRPFSREMSPTVASVTVCTADVPSASGSTSWVVEVDWLTPTWATSMPSRATSSRSMLATLVSALDRTRVPPLRVGQAVPET